MRILVVEDEPEIRRFLQKGLSEEAYQVDEAPEGILGLKMAESGDYDLILLDWMLPGLSGLDICQKLRNQGLESPIILLTARDTSEDVVLGLQSGADDYIRKPFHFAELLERIRVQLRKTSPTNKNVLRLGQIRMELSSHSVYRGDRAVALTKKEYALLEYLLRHKGQVCERPQILDAVWDSNYNYNEGIIDVYINNLRKKLDLAGKPSFIETIRGVGYLSREL